VVVGRDAGDPGRPLFELHPGLADLKHREQPQRDHERQHRGDQRHLFHPTSVLFGDQQDDQPADQREKHGDRQQVALHQHAPLEEHEMGFTGLGTSTLGLLIEQHDMGSTGLGTSALGLLSNRLAMLALIS
jgi:hypothetical protein